MAETRRRFSRESKVAAVRPLQAGSWQAMWPASQEWVQMLRGPEGASPGIGSARSSPARDGGGAKIRP